PSGSTTNRGASRHPQMWGCPRAGAPVPSDRCASAGRRPPSMTGPADDARTSDDGVVMHSSRRDGSTRREIVMESAAGRRHSEMMRLQQGGADDGRPRPSEPLFGAGVEDGPSPAAATDESWRPLDLVRDMARICRDADDVDLMLDRAIEYLCRRLDWSVAIAHLFEDGDLLARSSFQLH